MGNCKTLISFELLTTILGVKLGPMDSVLNAPRAFISMLKESAVKSSKTARSLTPKWDFVRHATMVMQ